MMSYPELSVACQALLSVSQDMLDLEFLVPYNRDVGTSGYDFTPSKRHGDIDSKGHQLGCQQPRVIPHILRFERSSIFPISGIATLEHECNYTLNHRAEISSPTDNTTLETQNGNGEFFLPRKKGD